MTTTPPVRDPAVAYQQRKIAQLDHDNRVLRRDNAELRQLLTIVMRKYLGESPAVINRDDLDAPAPEIAIDANLGGDMLIRVRVAVDGERQ